MSNFELVDWWLVGASAMWLGGLSVLLASLSWANYVAPLRRRSFRAVLAEPAYQLVLNGGLGLFCVGWAVMPEIAWWERSLWGGATVAFVWFSWQAWCSWRPT